jgi:hypothetical protein
MMSEPEVFFYVTGALVALYIVAASWRSRDAAYRPGEERQASTVRARTVDRRVIHWWRALRRGRSSASTR